MSNYTDTLKRGDKIGCYQIEEVLGRGGFAVTYLATDLNLDVEVAIKEYLPREITQRDNNLHVSPRKQEFAEDYDVGLQNFAREAKTLARFKHPHIVRVHQVLHANNTAYMVMDFEQGEELAEVMERQNTLSEGELRNILFPILDGVEEIHRHGFVHRDIKPSNIYIRQNGSPVLIDFGAARYTMSETTQQLTAVVTVGYTPIEQYNVSEDTQGPWSDIYALAAVCYEAVTGSVPTDSVTRASASVTNGNDPLPSVRAATKQEYTDDCLDAIDWGMRMEAEDRPQVIAQWRDSFDGVFNPASAYVARKDASIYSPHRVDTPLQSKTPAYQSQTNQARADQLQASQSRGNNDSEIVSIPLNQSHAPMDTGVVSLDPDAVTHSSVTSMPPIPPRVSVNQDSTMPAANQSGMSDNNRSDNTDNQHDLQHGNQKDSAINSVYGQAPRQRSKLERPVDAPNEPAPPRRTIRDEIEFDDSDWDYVPPKQSSPFKFLVPALGLLAVVGGSLLFVNNPNIVSNLFNNGPELTTMQALDIAKEKMEQSEYMFPAGESALDYYQLILASDPSNVEAKAGLASIESLVKQQITDNVEQDNLSEANRLLTRANDNGLQIYGLSTQSPAETTTTNNTAVTSPTVDSTDTTVVTAIDTAPIEPTNTIVAPKPEPAPVPESVPVPIEPIATASTGIDNTVSPFITEKIAEIKSLVQQGRYAEARELYTETDKYIPDQAASKALLREIEFREAESQEQPAVPVAVESTVPATTVATVTPEAPAPVQQPRVSGISGSGPAANHLNQLRTAIENKDMASVSAISQSLTAGRTQFLTRMFQRYDRLDVTIDNVNDRGNSVSAKLNVSMFKLNETGGYYAAGKWNGVALSATQENGEWQNIKW